MYLVLVVAAALTTALALAPVYLHRRLFRRHEKTTLVQYGHRLLTAALIGLLVVIIGTVLLIFDVAEGRSQAVVAALLVLTVIVSITVVPVRLATRRRHPPQESPPVH